MAPKASPTVGNGLSANGVLFVREEVFEYENLTDGYQDNQHGLGDRPIGHSGVQVLGAFSSGGLVQLVVRLLFEQSVQRLMNVIHTLLDLSERGWIKENGLRTLIVSLLKSNSNQNIAYLCHRRLMLANAWQRLLFSDLNIEVDQLMAKR